MKISTAFTAAFVATACLFQSTTAETEATTLLRVHNDNQGPICYKLCPAGQYCPRGETSCRAPTGDLCFNPATSLFQKGCDLGFKCSHGKCVYKSTAPKTESSPQVVHKQDPNGAICYKACNPGTYCPRGETECHAPADDWCFNPATSLFQQGCDAGFKCSNGKCVYKSTTPATETSPAYDDICYKSCPTGQYCPRGETECRAPTGVLCFNPATSLFQVGCDAGYKCSNGKCVKKSITGTAETSPANGAICYKSCPTGKYCPRGETECRAPTGDLCFNPATSLFQHGCARGYKCSYGKCVLN